VIGNVEIGWSGLRATSDKAAIEEPSVLQSPTVRGIVLAGVHAWGDCVLEQAVCRPLLPLAARPLIWHTLRWLHDGGVRRAVVCANSDTAVLRRALGENAGLDMSLDYFEDLMPRGPAGCVRDAAFGTDAEVILVTEGTLVPRIDLTALLRAHLTTGAAVTMVVGGAGFTHRRPGEGQEPLGIYMFSRSVLERVPATGYQDIKETLIPSLHRRGERIVTHEVPGDLAPRVTDAASYLGVNMRTVEEMVREGAVPSGYVRVGDAWVDPSARLDSTARFVGPVLVGPRSVIGCGTLIVGPTTIGTGCTIGRRAVVSRSAVWDRCHIGSGAIVDQSVLTNDARVDEELVVRETVYVPRRCNERKFLGRVVSYCQAAQRRTRVVSGSEVSSKLLRA